jgi:hypothetical protein
MKNSFFWLVPLFFIGCAGLTSSQSGNEKTPRREFIGIENIDPALHEPYTVNEFIADNNSFSKESVYFSTALLLSDIGILGETGKELFEKYAAVFFPIFLTRASLRK